MPDFYQTTENRVSIFSKYRAVKRHETYDPFTAICVEMETSHGNMLVYGTIIGIMGNREASFKKDLEKQMEDIRRLSSQGYTLCVVGDYNLSFHDNYYYTREGRNSVNNQFHSSGIELITKDVPECVDHIAVTKGFFESVVNIQEWNLDKTLSDHKGISIDALPAQLAT